MNDPFRASIAPVPSGTRRPLWSVMIPTFECATLLRGTLSSVLLQDQGSECMQIEVIDDRSTKDDPEKVVAEVGRGRVGFYQQPIHVGHIKNFETCLNRSRGFLIHLLHGDDSVCDGFYRKMQQVFQEHPEVGAAFCRHIFMDEKGNTLSVSPQERERSGVLENGLERIALEQIIMTPSIVVRREVYEHLGSFDSRLGTSEDWEMWVRIAAKYSIWYENEVLAAYRIHRQSNTGRYQRTGADMKYTRKAIGAIQSYLPAGRRDEITKRSRATYALSALKTAENMLQEHQWSGGLAQIREALLLHFSPITVQTSVKHLLRAASRWFRDV